MENENYDIHETKEENSFCLETHTNNIPVVKHGDNHERPQSLNAAPQHTRLWFNYTEMTI